jgi:7-cyano-7-deazaguanine synthase
MIGDVLTVNEIFHSIQGESTHAGRPCVFVRLAGCNLRCVWCDTAYAFHEGRSMSVAEVADVVGSFGCGLVELTGGEPLLQPESIPLMEELLRRGREVLLETGGSLPIEGVPRGVKRIVDVKCPASGESHRNLWDNLRDLRDGDELKFVVADRDDYLWAREQIARHELGRRTAGGVAALAGPRRARAGRAGALGARRRAARPRADPAPQAPVAGRRAGGLMAPRGERRPAVVLLSGGLDSATTMALASEQGHLVHALTVDYAQRHALEVERAAAVAASLGAESHTVVRVDLGAIGGSALTDSSIPVPAAGAAGSAVGAGIPVTYVPARNTILLALALARAEVLGAADVFFGANAIDYSGYPDCRPEFVRRFEALAAVATRAGVAGAVFRVHAPLIAMSKAEIVSEAVRLGVDLSLTLSCYRPSPEGRACGSCDACVLRARGFREAGVEDPARSA